MIAYVNRMKSIEAAAQLSRKFSSAVVMRAEASGLGHVLESQRTGAYFRVTKSRGRGALRRERDCVSTDS